MSIKQQRKTVARIDWGFQNNLLEQRCRMKHQSHFRPTIKKQNGTSKRIIQGNFAQFQGNPSNISMQRSRPMTKRESKQFDRSP